MSEEEGLFLLRDIDSELHFSMTGTGGQVHTREREASDQGVCVFSFKAHHSAKFR